MLDDDKTQYLKYHGIKVGVDFIVPQVKKTLFPLYLLYEILLNNKPDALIVRYLNDKKSFIYSFCVFISNYVTFSLSKIFNIKIIWFCHNIDKETIEYHPRMISLQRWFLAKYSKRIYVMDKLLIDVANKQFPDSTNKIDYISFGVRESNYRRVDELRDDLIITSIKEIRKKDDNAIIGFCPTNFGSKYLHIDYASELIESSRMRGFNLYIILVGNLKKYLSEHDEIKNKIYSNKHIIIIDEFVDYDAFQVSSLIDFYWRGLSDQSISYSLYEAATQKLPTLSLNVGFVGRAVKYYNLGSVVDLDMRNVGNAIFDIINWDSNNADKFLSSHSWDSSVKKIKEIL